MAKVLPSSILIVLCLCHFSCILNLADARSLIDINDVVPSSQQTQGRSKRTVDGFPTLLPSLPVSVDTYTFDRNGILPTTPIPLKSSEQFRDLIINGTEPRKNLTIVTGQSDSPHSDRPPVNSSTAPEEHYYRYYNGTIYHDPDKGKYYWVDMEKQKGVIVNEDLSNSYGEARDVKLSFSFPFYGHNKENVTVTTGGFIFAGNSSDVSELRNSQYIAPLMANFDTSLSNESFVRYVDNGTAFTVEWERVRLHDGPAGEFTFQVTLHKNGDIIFVYKNIPIPIRNISDDFDEYPVAVGLSDATIVGASITTYPSGKTTWTNIYKPYDIVIIWKKNVKNWTTIYLKPLRTCLSEYDCHSITNNDLDPNERSIH